jgi:hypothetical protein
MHGTRFSSTVRMGAHASRYGTGHAAMRYTRNATGSGTHTCTHMGARTGK